MRSAVTWNDRLTFVSGLCQRLGDERAAGRRNRAVYANLARGKSPAAANVVSGAGLLARDTRPRFGFETLACMNFVFNQPNAARPEEEQERRCSAAAVPREEGP